MNTRPTLYYKNVLLAACAWLPFLIVGCVSAGYGSRDITETRPDGTTVRTKEKHASYTDTTQAGNAAQQVFGEFGGIAGTLANLGTGGWAGVGAGLLGVLGIGAKTVHTIGKKTGEDKGWDERERAASVQAPLPGTVTATASTTGAPT